MSHADYPAYKPPSFPDEQRLAVRSRIHLAISLITPAGDIHSAILTNISSRGFRIRSNYGVTIGRFLSLDVPELARYSGWVAWSHSGEFGLEVANSVPQKVIDHIVANAAKD